MSKSTQRNLFSARDEYMPKLKALRAEFAQRAKENEHKRRVLDQAMRSEAQWDAVKAGCRRLK